MRAYAGAVNGMNSNQGLEFGCVTTESLSAEFSLDVPLSASKSCRDAWTFAGVTAYVLVVSAGQAVVSRHQGLQPTPAYLPW